jgi:hypothetical protein
MVLVTMSVVAVATVPMMAVVIVMAPVMMSSATAPMIVVVRCRRHGRKQQPAGERDRKAEVAKRHRQHLPAEAIRLEASLEYSSPEGNDHSRSVAIPPRVPHPARFVKREPRGGEAA